MRSSLRLCKSLPDTAAGSVFLIGLIALGLLAWKGCHGLPANVANCPGPHTIVIAAEDVAGYIATATTHVNIGMLLPGVSSIQNLPGWQSCSAALANGFTCAAGLGTAASKLIQGQSSPSLDGSAAQFTIGGTHPYSNELYWYPVGGGSSVERVGNQVHYMTLSVGDQDYTVDIYYTAQPNWYQEEIDIAFQLDGNYKQQPYNVWLDEVTLNAY